jgi:hypothetical protein
VTVEISHRATIVLPSTAVGHRIDATHTAPIVAWLESGSPTQPNATQQAAMESASVLAEEAVELERVSSTLSVLTSTMQRESVFHVQFE